MNVLESSLNPVLTEKQILVKTTANVGGAVGEMMFGSSAFKKESNTGSNIYIFTVAHGGFEVIINDQKRLVDTGMTFAILPNLNYSIRNRSGKRAELTFVISHASGDGQH